MFGPVAVVAGGPIRLSKKGAVASVPAFYQSDVEICGDLATGLSRQTDERVIQSMENQRRNGNTIKHTGSGCAVVVIVRAGEARIKCRDAMVELTQRVDSCGAVSIISL